MKTKGRRISSNIDEVDPIENEIMRYEYKENQQNIKKKAKADQEDKASVSPYLTKPKAMSKITPTVLDDAISATKNRNPDDRAMRLKNNYDTYPSQKLQRIQVTPGKWKSKGG